MAGILPEKYQAYRNGQISYAEATGASSVPAPAAPKPSTSNSTPYSQGNNYGTSYTPSNTPSPAAVYAPAPSYQSSAPSYSAPTYNTPAPAASSYTGASSMIGNVSGSKDLGKSYQSIYDSTRTPSTANSQLNTWADNKGNVYDTTAMTAQQIHALSLFKDGNPNAAAILKGMGLDMNGNPTSPIPAPSAGGSMNANSSTAPSTNQNGGAVQLPGGGWAPPANNGQMSQSQIQAEAAAKIAQQVSERTRIANQTKSGFNTSYDRLQQQTKDNRALENVANQRNLNPFSGRSDYAQGMIGREREITDRQNQQDLQTRLGSVDTQLSDFLNQTPEMQQQIVNDLTRQEREYGLQVGTLTGNLAGYGQTLASKNQEFNQGMAQQQLALQGKQLDLTAQNQQFNQQQDIKKQHIDLANFLTQQYGVTVLPTDDPMLSYAQVAGIPTTAAQKIAIDAQNSNFDNAVKKALAENTITKTQSDILQGAQQLSIAQQNANTSSANAGTSAAGQATSAARLEWEKSQAANKPKDFKTSPEFAKDIAHIKNNPTEASKLDSNPQPFIEAYGYDGYLALRKAAGIDD